MKKELKTLPINDIHPYANNPRLNDNAFFVFFHFRSLFMYWNYYKWNERQNNRVQAVAIQPY